MHDDGVAGIGSETAPGTMIAQRYRLERTLGRGGMGVVWEALDTSLDRKVAVKGLLYSGAASVTRAQWVNRARREAQAIARIEHQNVVTVHDVIEDGNQVWIVMELLNSRSLADLLLEQQQLAVPHTARIALQVLRGLIAVHEAGVVHRDVKPQNILFRSDGRALLMDFGIATFEGAVQVTRTHEIIGTALYLAPELLSPTPDQPRAATAASDLWALGVTLYEMVEGRRPFQGATHLEVLIAVRESPVPPMKYAGPLSTLIKALLSKDPAERPNAAEAEQMLQAVALDSLALDTPSRPKLSAAAAAFPDPDAAPAPVPAPESGRVPGASRPEAGIRGRWGKWKIPVAVLCATLLAGGGGWFVWGKQDSSGKKDDKSVSGRPGNEKTYQETDGTLQVGVKSEQPGLSVRKGKTKQYEGFEPALAEEIGSLMGYEPEDVEFVPVTTNDRDDLLVTDKVDIVVATYSIDEKRNKEEGVEFLGPYYLPMKAVLVKGGLYDSLDDLQYSESSEICTAQNSTYDEEWFDKNHLTRKEFLPGTYEDCIEQLEYRENHTDAVATDDVIAAGYRAEHPDWKIIKVERDPGGYGIAVKRSDKESAQLLKRDVCRALSQIIKKPSGGKSVYDKLYDSHLKDNLDDLAAPEAPELEKCEPHMGH